MGRYRNLFEVKLCIKKRPDDFLVFKTRGSYVFIKLCKQYMDDESYHE